MRNRLAPVATALPSRRERIRRPVWTLASLGVATLALRLHDPHQHLSWGVCPTTLVGFQCPFCGALRGVNDLTRGDVAAAASNNLLLVAALPFVVVALGVWTLDRWRGTTRELPPRLVHAGTRALLATLVVFTVLRNLPFGWAAWLAP